MEKAIDKYVINTEDGNTYRVEYVNADFGTMPIRIDDSTGESYKDLEDLENDIALLVDATYIFCFNPETGEPVIVPKKIIENSLIAIRKVV